MAATRTIVLLSLLLQLHLSVLTTLFFLLSIHYPLSTIHYPLPTTSFFLRTTHYSLLITYYSLPTTHYPLPTTHYLPRDRLAGGICELLYVSVHAAVHLPRRRKALLPQQTSIAAQLTVKHRGRMEMRSRLQHHRGWQDGVRVQQDKHTADATVQDKILTHDNLYCVAVLGANAVGADDTPCRQSLGGHPPRQSCV